MLGTILTTNIEALLVFCAVFLYVYIYVTKNKRVSLPPGPYPVPVLGNILSLGPDPREPLCKLTAKYGDVLTIHLGPKPTVMLCSYDAIKEAFVKHSHIFSGRPQDLFFVKEITFGLGIVSTEGQRWREQRKFVHGTLRDFGMGKKTLEEKIQEELSFFLSKINDQHSVPFDIFMILGISISNTICSIVFGERYDYEDPTFQQIMITMKGNFEIVGNMGALNLFPVLKHLPGDFFQYKKLMKTGEGVKEWFRAQMRQHKATRQQGVSRDLIDSYLEEMDRLKDEESYFDDNQLEAVISDLFGAGTETMTSTLSWAVIYMMHHPLIQQKVKNEIHEVIGPERMVSMSDKPSLPYTEACINEIQRMAEVVPLGVPHTVTEDIRFRGYDIPKGTTIMSNLYAAHRDPKVWDKPYEFNPERFIDADGKLCKIEKLIPFSMGKRVCLGESLARMELFLGFTSMIQKFTFTNPPGKPLPSTTGKLGMTNMPHPFTVIAVPN